MSMRTIGLVLLVAAAGALLIYYGPLLFCMIEFEFGLTWPCFA